MNTDSFVSPQLTASEFRDIQRALDLTDRALAANLGLSAVNGHVTVRRMKRGEIPVAGPVSVSMLAFASGFRPAWWSDVHVAVED